MAYISNGLVAWEIPWESERRYLKGLYHPPAGWFVILRIPSKSRQLSGGQWTPPDGEIFVDDRGVQAAATAILRKTRKNNQGIFRGIKHAKNI
jgi:hypothetical protein